MPFEQTLIKTTVGGFFDAARILFLIPVGNRNYDVHVDGNKSMRIEVDAENETKLLTYLDRRLIPSPEKVDNSAAWKQV